MKKSNLSINKVLSRRGFARRKSVGLFNVKMFVPVPWWDIPRLLRDATIFF